MPLVCLQRLERYQPGDVIDRPGDADRWRLLYARYCADMDDEELRAYRRRLACEEAENVILTEDDPRVPRREKTAKREESETA
jgi:hypothetical protein